MFTEQLPKGTGDFSVNQQVGPVSLSGPHTSTTVIWERGAFGERALPPRSANPCWNGPPSSPRMRR